MKSKFSHLNINERYKIKEMRDKGLTITEIAKKLNRAKSSISVEIRRNKNRGDYLPCVAHKKYEERLRKEDGLKIEKDPILKSYIVEKMKGEHYSPDVISGRLKLDKNLPNISTESIYRFIYTSPMASTLALYRHLPTKRIEEAPRESQERAKREAKDVKGVVIPARTSVHEREAVANHKVEIGRFEGDLTFHKGNQSANIGCMVDKKSQKVFLVKNASKRTSSVTTGIFSKDEVYPRKG